MANWSQLFHDILVVIVRLLTSYDDFLSFSEVCISWRLAAVAENLYTSRRVPWLMLPRGGRFYSLPSSKIYKFTLPEANRKKCLTSQGWLITVGEDAELNLLHPVTRVHINLPHQRTFKDYESLDNGSFTFIDKAALSSSPSRTTNYTVMVIYGSLGHLAFWRPGDSAWTRIETRHARYQDVIYYKGQFHAVDCRGQILVCDIEGPKSTMAEVVAVVPYEYVIYTQLYLVESWGTLLIVSRAGVQWRPVKEGSSKGTYGTTGFRVLELDNSNGTLMEVKGLGNRALFLGHGSSFSVEVSEVNRCQANCIYFTDDCSDVYWNTRKGGGKDMGIYNLEDGSIVPCFRSKSYSHITPPLWLAPGF